MNPITNGIRITITRPTSHTTSHVSRMATAETPTTRHAAIAGVGAPWLSIATRRRGPRNFR